MRGNRGNSGLESVRTPACTDRAKRSRSKAAPASRENCRRVQRLGMVVRFVFCNREDPFNGSTASASGCGKHYGIFHVDGCPEEGLQWRFYWGERPSKSGHPRTPALKMLHCGIALSARSWIVCPLIHSRRRTDKLELTEPMLGTSSEPDQKCGSDSRTLQLPASLSSASLGTSRHDCCITGISGSDRRLPRHSSACTPYSL